MSHTNSTNMRLRVLNPMFYAGWEDVNETNNAADDIIKTPEKYLLAKNALFEAEGGYGGLGVQCVFMLLGAGAVFGAKSRVAAHWRTGSMSFYEWLMLGSGSAAGYAVGQNLSVNMMGNKQAFNNHWMAYGFVKSANRWEGRQILSKAYLHY